MAVNFDSLSFIELSGSMIGKTRLKNQESGKPVLCGIVWNPLIIYNM